MVRIRDGGYSVVCHRYSVFWLGYKSRLYSILYNTNQPTSLPKKTDGLYCMHGGGYVQKQHSYMIININIFFNINIKTWMQIVYDIQ